MKNNKKANALNAQSTSETVTNNNEVKNNVVELPAKEASETKDAQTPKETQATNETQASEQSKRDFNAEIAEIDKQLDMLSKSDFSKLDSKQIIKLGKEIETLQKQKAKLEKEKKASEKEATNSIKEASKKAKEALEQQANENRALCESIAKKELELTIFQRMLSALDQSAIWTFNAWTESDFLLERDNHLTIIEKLESNSKLIDAFELEVKTHVETLSNEVRQLHISNAELMQTDIMKQCRRKINGLSKEAMDIIVKQTSNEVETTSEQLQNEVVLSDEKRQKLNANTAKQAKVA